MKDFWKEFCKRGLLVSCAGPLIVGIVYVCVAASGNLTSLTPYEVCVAIVSSSVMTFVAAGITAIYTIESMPLIKAVLLHAVILYIDYLALYLLNSWLPLKVSTIAIFTSIYVVGYAIIWLCIYLVMRKHTEKLNRKIKGL